jgi:hypothetical protein
VNPFATASTNTAPLISKSKFVWGLQCGKLLWYAHHAKHLIPEVDASQEAAFEQGHEVGALVRQLFPDGIEVGSRMIDTGETVKLTTEALTKRVPLFEAAFSASGGYCRVDILQPAGDADWDIIEVKSSTGVKDVHLYDLAFQLFVLTAAGLKIRRCVLAHINSDFIKHGEIDPKKFFTLEDVTDQVVVLSRSIEDKLGKMSAIIGLQQSPEIQIGKHCDDPYPCPLYDHCWSFLPESNVTTLYRGGAKGFKLIADGIPELKDIPDDFKLTDNQEIQRRAAITGQPHIDKPAIKAFLKQLQYPISYLDFETVATAIPLFDGVRPYQQIPFQFSLHVVRSEGTQTEHHKFLAEGRHDPRPEFMRQLRENLPAEGSVVTFNASFELSRLKECCDLLPQFKPWVRAVRARVVDLLLPFRGFRYHHPKQNGSASMKAVLPALVGKGYNQLTIQDGTTASLQFLRATFGKISAYERATIRQQLDEYCGLDTLGMVWIVDALGQVAGNQSSPPRH